MTSYEAWDTSSAWSHFSRPITNLRIRVAVNFAREGYYFVRGCVEPRSPIGGSRLRLLPPQETLKTACRSDTFVLWLDPQANESNFREPWSQA